MKGRTSHITLLLSSSDIEKRAIGINSLKSLMNYEVSSPAIKSYQDNLKVALEKYEKQKTDALLSNLLKIIDKTNVSELNTLAILAVACGFALAFDFDFIVAYDYA